MDNQRENNLRSSLTGSEGFIMNDKKLEHRIFVEDEKPYCFWGWGELKDLTLEFLDSIDPTYFQYIAKVHTENTTEKEEQKAAIALRTAYSQGLEALFALLRATVQSYLR